MVNYGNTEGEVIFIVRQERLDDAKRERLIEAAIEEFAERGFDAASYNRIIEKSGLSKGSVYYYFENKDSLIATVLDEVCKRFQEVFKSLDLPTAKDEYWSVAWEYHERVIMFLSENPVVAQVMYRISKEDARAANGGSLCGAHRRLVGFMDDLLIRGRELGAVRSDLPIEVLQRVMHAAGEALSSEIVGAYPDTDKDLWRAKFERFMVTMHDLSKRMLTPEEVV
ncbi:TetR family transcriptional regulator [Synergistales bacterium]|nr:TetR family transcriptional regulator [Synergistales bacterium]